MTTRPSFAFNKKNQAEIAEIMTRYPADRKRSALLPLLDLAQRQSGGWLPHEALEEVARLLEISPMQVYEVASFYSMFNLKPVGKNLIQICRTTPCWLRGSDELRQVCAEQLNIKPGETTEDELFTFMEVECLGACANAPVVQINDTYYEDLDAKAFEEILALLSKGKTPPSGSAKNRTASKACLAPSVHHSSRRKS